MATDNQSNVVAVKADGARAAAARPATVQEPSIGAVPPSAPKAAPHDPYDPQRLRLTTNFGEALAVKQHLITVPMRKPDRHWWIRTHPDHDFEAFVLEDNGDVYIVEPSIAELCPQEVVPKRLYLAVNTTKTAFLVSIPFDEIWVVDFEFRAEPGELPEPICLVARELRSGRAVTCWQDELRASTAARTGPTRTA
jgi:hypothetical protein